MRGTTWPGVSTHDGQDCPHSPPWHMGTVSRVALLFATITSIALPCIAFPSSALAYDHQMTLGAAAGWGVAPTFSAPDNGPNLALSSTIGFDDTWGMGVYAAWAVHPPFNGGRAVQVGFAGVEGLYYIDILQVVPFFGVGVDVLPTYDGNTDRWNADFAAHLRASVDYLLSREVVIGLDVRPYVLLTALSTQPVYISFMARVSYVFDY